MQYIRDGKYIVMKKRIQFLLPLMALCAGCSNLFEEQLDIYENAITELNETGTLESLIDNVFNTETAIAGKLANHSEEEDEALQETLGEEYRIMKDSVHAVRVVYYRVADSLFGIQSSHFVEKRILLYEKAAGCFDKAKSVEELVAVDEALKRYSAMAYKDGQRVCDPPVTIRSRYDSIKSLARKKYDNALLRLPRW